MPYSQEDTRGAQRSVPSVSSERFEPFELRDPPPRCRLPLAVYVVGQQRVEECLHLCETF